MHIAGIVNGQQSNYELIKALLKAGTDRFFFFQQNTTKRKHTGMSFTQHENPSLNMKRIFTSNEETSVLWLVFGNQN